MTSHPTTPAAGRARAGDVAADLAELRATMWALARVLNMEAWYGAYLASWEHESEASNG
jgi:hypothetical protein